MAVFRCPNLALALAPNNRAQRCFASKRRSVDAVLDGANVRVRFAPSPTGNLHVGGARTALFNYLYAKHHGGKFILRIEDTDLERSSKESEEAMLRDLHWLGLEWDEGPDKGGEAGPYRQSERNSIYKYHADKLLESGHVYRCFCSDEELEHMKREANQKNLPPRYTGKWGGASKDEIEAELAKKTPYTYRFRVPQKGSVTIKDLIRGKVAWNKDALGDFVILRSNGQPVYNFCVAIDDSSMKISHVIRAEEHLSNTLRQVLIYNALSLPLPKFGHVSLILAPDRSKLSKRHGATSVGQFKEMGLLPEAMTNYLVLLGWNDGSNQEVFSMDELVEKFSLDRITKSPAIFDMKKLSWMNGQHLRHLPMDQLVTMIGEHWVKSGIVSDTQNSFVRSAVEILKNTFDIVSRSDEPLMKILSYPLEATLESKGESVEQLEEDVLKQVAKAIVQSYESGELEKALENGSSGWSNWTKALSNALNLKGKKLFMPMRLLLTGNLHGTDLGASMLLLHQAHKCRHVLITERFVKWSERMSLIEKRLIN